MLNRFLKPCVALQSVMIDEQGQDLMEYALLCMLLALALISGVGQIAAVVNRLFTEISTSIP